MSSGQSFLPVFPFLSKACYAISRNIKENNIVFSGIFPVLNKVFFSFARGLSHSTFASDIIAFKLLYMPESLSNLLFIFFVLSLLSERVAEWLKFQNWFKSLFRIQNTTLKLPSEKEEQKRYFRILKINIAIAIMVAILIRADLFYLFSHPQPQLGWPTSFAKLRKLYEETSVDFLSDVKLVLVVALGCVLTGFFLSFGSKLWHDLLDIVLAFKEAKRQVAGGFPVANPTSFSTLNNSEQQAAINGAIETFSAKWLNTIPGFAGVGTGKKPENPAAPGKEELVLEFLVDETKQTVAESFAAVPSFVNYGGINIPTVVRGKRSSIKPQWKNPGGDTVPPRAGQSISRIGSRITGTISLKVTRKEDDGTTRNYLLSCYHVLFGDELQQGTLQVKADSALFSSRAMVSPGRLTKMPGQQLATARLGHINEFIDAGIALLDESDGLSDIIDELGRPSDLHLVTGADINTLEVQFCGAKSGKITGKKIKACNQRRHYDISAHHPNLFLRDLIELDKCSEEGDSGAPVMDSNENLIGIIIGADDTSTYIVPIQNIINNLKVFPKLKSKPV